MRSAVQLLSRRTAASVSSGKVHRVLTFNGAQRMKTEPHRLTHVCALGDGIGPEIVRAARRAIVATGVNVDWVEMSMVRLAHVVAHWLSRAPGAGPTKLLLPARSHVVH